MGKYYALSQQVIEVGDTFQSVADALAELEARVNTLEATSKRIYMDDSYFSHGGEGNEGNGCELPVKEIV